MAREKLMYSPTVFSFNEPGFPNGKIVESEAYRETVRTKKVGDTVRSWAGAPGTGYIDQIITRIDSTGVYGIITRNTVRELTPEEVR
jgi:hypothetical protein